MRRIVTLIVSAFFCTLVFAHNKVAVFNPEDKSNTTYADIVREMFSIGISKSGKYIPVERALISKVLEENKYQNTGMVDDSKISELGKQMGADYVCVSMIKKMGNNYFVTAKLVNVTTASVQFQEYVRTTAGDVDFFRKVEQLATKLSEAKAVATTPKPKITQNVNDKEGTFTDPRDNRTYKYVTIGNLTWMAENLAYRSSGSWVYDNDPYNERMYGRLYTWRAARNVCPDGWHLPSDGEWSDLEIEVGGRENAGRVLKAKKRWHDNGNGTDQYGFAALPGGYRIYDGGLFRNMGKCVYWWSSTESSSEEAYRREVGYDHETVNRYENNKSFGFSVRCVRDY